MFCAKIAVFQNHESVRDHRFSWAEVYHPHPVQVAALEHFLALRSSPTIELQASDTFGQQHTLRVKTWVNTSTKMYVLEGTRAVQDAYRARPGDALVFARDPSGKLYILVRPGSAASVRGARQKSPSPRLPTPPSAAALTGQLSRELRGLQPQPAGEPSAAAPVAAGPGVSRHLSRELRALLPKLPTAIPTAFPTGVPSIAAAEARGPAAPTAFAPLAGARVPTKFYPLEDGVYRVVPPAFQPDTLALVKGSGCVFLQYGSWTVVLDLAGELYQAFFLSENSALDSFEATGRSSFEE